ncbi:hypothetical protein QMK19_18040 [Streptomyces sp. H10-C2]|uniref:hypothetical protein n=1 Tax=unclassified Streptomyces TaxID=2593676 RepID=UPI0024BAF2BC|nr:MULTISPECIES: hypothetical protein [unclassified Streptomyces]MDJ0343453.1 hypothetical protein [Streptomyces sp. PH10-H1]MDJ0371533.1 hypothetical protein [Streptomyces sp. H10-C2]
MRKSVSAVLGLGLIALLSLPLTVPAAAAPSGTTDDTGLTIVKCWDFDGMTHQTAEFHLTRSHPPLRTRERHGDSRPVAEGQCVVVPPRIRERWCPTIQ